MRESNVEKYLVKRVKELGGKTRKLKWIGRRGAPDRFVMLYGGFFVELKALGEKLRPEQQREHDTLRGHGVEVYTLDSVEAIEELLASRLPIKKFLARGLFPKPVCPP